MARRISVVGIPAGEIDSVNDEARFVLQTTEGKEIEFVAQAGPLAQILTSLGTLNARLRAVLIAKKVLEPAAQETVTDVRVQKEPRRDMVLLELTCSSGAVHSFAVPAQNASDMANRLKTESGMRTPAGKA